MFIILKRLKEVVILLVKMTDQTTVLMNELQARVAKQDFVILRWTARRISAAFCSSFQSAVASLLLDLTSGLRCLKLSGQERVLTCVPTLSYSSRMSSRLFFLRLSGHLVAFICLVVCIRPVFSAWLVSPLAGSMPWCTAQVNRVNRIFGPTDRMNAWSHPRSLL